MDFVKITIAVAEARLPFYDPLLIYLLIFHYAHRKFLMYCSNRLEELSYFLDFVLLVWLITSRNSVNNQGDLQIIS